MCKCVCFQLGMMALEANCFIFLCLCYLTSCYPGAAGRETFRTILASVATTHDPTKQFSAFSMKITNLKKLQSSLPTIAYEMQPPLSVTGPGRYFNRQKRSKLPSVLLRHKVVVPTETDCPARCECSYRSNHVVDIVDCSRRGLTAIPKLPATCREVYLQDNDFHDISCTSFRSLRMLKKLNLSRNKITILPKCSLYNLTSLEHIWLSECKLTSLPVGIFDSLHQLLYLNLSANTINSIDKHLFLHLGKLNALSLSTNSITEIRNRTFRGLKSLKHLSLQGNKLRYVPETFEAGAFHGLTSLETLHLEGNQRNLTQNFSYPHQALAEVPTLQRLWLDGYPRALGPGFSTLANLKYISFTGGANGFCSMQSDIPPHFFFHLRTKQPLSIDFSHCGISTISPELFTFVPTLDALDLSLNYDLTIEGFEKASEGLQNSTITVLNISRIVQSYSYINFIRNTTFRFLKHTNLKELVVEHCNIVNVDPQAIFDLPQTLESTSFQGNVLWWPYAILSASHLINLREANVGNQMEYPGHSYENYHSSHHTNKTTLLSSGTLDVPTGDIDRSLVSRPSKPVTAQRSLKDYLTYLPLPQRLEVLYAGGLKISHAQSIPQMTVINNKVLRYFDFSLNGIKYMFGPIYGMPSLKYADLSRNFCIEINPRFFSYVHTIQTLLLYQNMLGRALAEDVKGVIFSYLTDLETLDISNNIIEHLPELSFTHNRNLRLLNISNNELVYFQPNLGNNRKLETLDLTSNLLVGLSESTCTELQTIKSCNPNFTVQIERNNFLCDCENVFFLNFLLDQPEIFENVNKFYCQMPDGSGVSYAKLGQFLPRLILECQAQSVFVAVLTTFFLVSGALAGCGLYQFKRWQWKYLYYVGKSRLHIGSTQLTYRHVAHTFITYDQENYRLRNLVRNVVLPRLHEMGVTTVLGETDFAGGPVAPSIAGAVTSTGKTLVFLSPTIFQEHYRHLEVNLAIMHELHLRRPILVPVVLLTPDTNPAVRQRDAGNKQDCGTRQQRQGSRPRDGGRSRTTQSDYARFRNLLRNFPPEISTFLQGQIHRCLVYPGDSDLFWQHLKTVIMDQ